MNTNNLTTLDNAKAALRIAASDTSSEALLSSYIDRASQWIEDMCERKMKCRNYNGNSSLDVTKVHSATKIVDEDYLYFSGSSKGQGGDTTVQGPIFSGKLYLPAYPVRPNAESGASTFNLAYLKNRDSTGETWDSTSLIEFQDYVVDRNTGILTMLYSPFIPGFRNYRITMTAGYLIGSAQPYVPVSLDELCVAVIRKMYTNDFGKTSERLGTWSKTFDAKKESVFIDNTIALYRRFSM